ncbi:MAG: nucleotidyltransferase domain-containing protein [Chloroflexota bacterium]
MAEYRAGARQREAERQAALDERFQRAWEVARQGAEILKSQFQAEKVVVFGSLTDRSRFHQRSDIDLAAWGTSEKSYLKALGRVMDVTSEFMVDFVRIEEARDHIRKSIERDGVEL